MPGPGSRGALVQNSLINASARAIGNWMNRVLQVAAVWLVPLAIWAQTATLPRVSAGQAADYIGKNVVVTGRVAEVHVAEKLVRLNLDRPFPQQPFTAVIFSNRTNLFKDLPTLKGEAVEVTGTVAEYRNKPEIILNRTSQLAVVPKPKK
jgi:hypothetical protein